jgi:methyl-accepting chemotaxis protein
MSLDAQIKSRTKLYDIDESTWELGRSVHAAAGGTVRPVLDEFKLRLSRDPIYNDLVTNHIDTINKLNCAQVDEFLKNGFSDTYFTLLENTSQVEFKSNIGARIHIAMCIHILDAHFMKIGSGYSFIGRIVAKKCSQLLRLMFMDVFNVIALDQIKTQEKMKERNKLIDGEMEDFYNAATDLTRVFSRTAGGIDKATDTTINSMREAGEQSRIMSKQIKVTASNLKAASENAQSLSTSILQIDKASDESREIVTRAVLGADSAQTEVGHLVGAIESIGSVASLISEIANQTNLLALNATIEAARAGEAGRGFAVVANEVKSLAEQTARATEDISARIATIREAGQRSENAIGSVNSSLDSINTVTNTIGKAVADQKAATEEIARMVTTSAEQVMSFLSTSETAERSTHETIENSNQLRELSESIQTDSRNSIGKFERIIQRIKGM